MDEGCIRPHASSVCPAEVLDLAGEGRCMGPDHSQLCSGSLPQPFSFHFNGDISPEVAHVLAGEYLCSVCVCVCMHNGVHTCESSFNFLASSPVMEMLFSL